MKATTVLRRVLKLFEDGRWVQGDWNEKKGRINSRGNRRPPPVQCFCMGGAIAKAEGADMAGGGVLETFSESAATPFVLEAIGKAGYVFEAVWTWNDDKSRTIGDILKATRKALKLAEKAEA